MNLKITGKFQEEAIPMTDMEKGQIAIIANVDGDFYNCDGTGTVIKIKHEADEFEYLEFETNQTLSKSYVESTMVRPMIEIGEVTYTK